MSALDTTPALLGVPGRLYLLFCQRHVLKYDSHSMQFSVMSLMPTVFLCKAKKKQSLCPEAFHPCREAWLMGGLE